MSASRVVLGTDHAGYLLKEVIKKHLESRGVSIVDCGCYSEESCDYPPIMLQAAAAVKEYSCPGIIFGGSGNGEAIVANKVDGIRCARCVSLWDAEMARKHNDAQMMSLGGRVTTPELACEMVDCFLSTQFEGGRHEIDCASILMQQRRYLYNLFDQYDHCTLHSCGRFSHFQAEVDSIAPYAEWVQVDVMDGHFVPNLSFGAPVIKSLTTSCLIDVHLMVTNPADRIDEFLAVGAKNITFHAEVVASTDKRRSLIRRIRSGGATAGIAINPETPLPAIDDVKGEVDLVLIMSVHPGFGGQSFIPSVLEKVIALREQYPSLMIQMDGGIDATTATLAKEAGANNLVAGSYIFRAKDRKAAIAALR